MKRNLLQVLLALALFGVVIQVVLIAPHAVKDHEAEHSSPTKTEEHLGPTNQGGLGHRPSMPPLPVSTA